MVEVRGQEEKARITAKVQTLIALFCILVSVLILVKVFAPDEPENTGQRDEAPVRQQP